MWCDSVELCNQSVECGARLDKLGGRVLASCEPGVVWAES